MVFLAQAGDCRQEFTPGPNALEVMHELKHLGVVFNKSGKMDVAAGHAAQPVMAGVQCVCEVDY